MLRFRKIITVTWINSNSFLVYSNHWPQRQCVVCSSFRWRRWVWSPTDTARIQLHRV